MGGVLSRAVTLLLMLISVEQIDVWRREPTETEVLEFKEAKNQFDTEKLFSVKKYDDSPDIRRESSDEHSDF
jgi:hypothetical protein